ncbi:Bacterial alpha-L-rhamnosidase [Limihaloglobus sulfuriphilus]|uniref:Bacterial alpha-L-rhamnosidase n=1 Tax=Limihaloglobus sulfuriphilus TaxID=1851148 RepID=A0A1Q2MG24_9BACT|nr:family 78 glycoside hydrolase catalytic domain [Limihaloglobus sulfuriphilus]AQQ71631.1 Bacterial alpha-L-rhamnosidase [Limihaloglobus sulfuriphilus]
MIEKSIDKNTKWIWLKDERYPFNHWVEFRETFQVDRLSETKVLIAADTSYQLWINGEAVDDAYFSEFPDDRYYLTKDISGYIKPGKNCLAVLGYYQGINTSRYVKGRAGILFEIQTEGGSLVKSDAGSRARTSPAYLSGDAAMVTPQLGPTIQYDGSKDDGWQSLSYDDSGWGSAQEIAAADEFTANGLGPYPLKRFEQNIKTARVCSNGLLENVPDGGTFADMVSGADLKYLDGQIGSSGITLTAAAEGSFVIFDLLSEECGYLRLELEADDVTVIDIAHGEHLADGRVRAKIEDRNFADRYIARPGAQLWSMPVRKLGCRYIELHVRNSRGRVNINSVSLRTQQYPLSFSSDFACSDRLIERIVDVSKKTARLCMLENYCDTPWREQSLYPLDVLNQALCGYYLFGNYEYAEKSLRVMGKARFDDTYLAMCAPSDNEITIPSFTMFWIEALRDYTLYSGDTNLAEEHFGFVRNFIFSMISRLEDNVLKVDTSKRYWNFYEWSPGLDGNGPHSSDEKSYHSCISLFLIESIGCYNDICGFLGRDSRVPGDVIRKIQSGIREKYYSKSAGLFTNEFPADKDCVFSELTQSLACIYMDLEDQELETVGRHIGTDTDLSGATLSMKRYVFNALENIFKDSSPPLDIIRRDWGYMISKGCSSFWETIKGESDFNGAGSLSHGWSIIPVYYIYSRIIGIKPLEPGFRRFAVSPRCADLDSIKGSVPTPFGEIIVQRQRTAGKTVVEVEYPDCLEMAADISDDFELISHAYAAEEKETAALIV